MVDIESIRKLYFVQGWSIRKISKVLGYARQSVRKAIASSAPPRYHLREPRPRPVVGPYLGVIEQWLREDEEAPRKQRHTARRIYQRLVAEYGFTGGESTVRQVVAELRGRQVEPYIPLVAAPGEMAQVDWGPAVVIIGGRRTEVQLFCLRLRFSGVAFVRAYPTQRLEAFLDGHCRAFAWLEGVPACLVYDNPKTAVVRILQGPEREEHVLFASLRAHYLFESRFCRPGQAHEKGGVENLVGYVRRSALVPLPDLPDWEGLNAHLLAWCEHHRHQRLPSWEVEQAALRALPAHPFRCSITRMVKVNALSLVHFDRNRYSVPTAYIGRTLQLEAFADRLELWSQQRLVATHPRSYGRGETLLVLDHYLDALARKPRAVLNARVVRQLPEVYERVRQRLCAARPDGYRDFCALLLLHREFPAEQVRHAMEQALAMGMLEPATVRQLLLNQTAPQVPGPVPVPPAFRDVQLAPADLGRYNALLEGRRTS